MKVKMVILPILGVLLLFALSPTVNCIAEDLPPIPPIPAEYATYKISPPNPALAPEINRFLGEWPEGVWETVRGIRFRRAKMIVIEITGTEAKILWDIGDNPHGSTIGAKWSNIIATIEKEEDGKICLYFPSQQTASLLKFYVEGKCLVGKQRLYSYKACR